MKKLIRSLGERGISSIEYTVITALIAMVIILAATGIGEKVGDIFIGVGSSFPK